MNNRIKNLEGRQSIPAVPQPETEAYWQIRTEPHDYMNEETSKYKSIQRYVWKNESKTR